MGGSHLTLSNIYDNKDENTSTCFVGNKNMAVKVTKYGTYSIIHGRYYNGSLFSEKEKQKKSQVPLQYSCYNHKLRVIGFVIVAISDLNVKTPGVCFSPQCKAFFKHNCIITSETVLVLYL